MLVEPLAIAILTWRRIGIVPMVLRAIVALAAVVALMATALPAWDVPNGYVVVAALFASVWTLAPDSHTGLAFVGVLAMAWLTSAPGELDVAVVVTALALLVAHSAAALAAAMPASADAEARLVLRWARPTAAIGGAVLGAVGVLALFDTWSSTGSLAVTLGGLGLITAAAWWWSTPPDRDGSTATTAWRQSRLRTAHRSGNRGVNSVERR